MSDDNDFLVSVAQPDRKRLYYSDMFGQRKTLAGLDCWEWAFLILSCCNTLIVIGLSLERMITSRTEPDSFDFTYSLLLLINCCFCLFYIFIGVLRERRYEMYTFMAAAVLVLIYCILEYSLDPAGRNLIKLIRLIVASVLVPLNVILAVRVAYRFGWLEFYIAGASQAMQQLYRQQCFYLSLLRFDVQAALSFVILIVKNGKELNFEEILTLGIGIPFTIICFILGYISIVREYKWLVWCTGFLYFIEPSYIIFKVIMVYLGGKELTSCFNNIAASCIDVYSIMGVGFFALLVRVILYYELFIVYRNFGYGLSDREFINLVTERTSLLSQLKIHHDR